MNQSKRRAGYSFLRKDRFKATKSNLDLDSRLEDFSSLKKQVKKIEIVTRMENRQKTSMSTHVKGRPSTSMTKPSTRHVPGEFRRIGKEYQREKSLIRTTLQEQQRQLKENQNGLLGQWRRYEEFSKSELIEKLISLEHLANTIFKRNKRLEQEMSNTRLGRGALHE